MYICIFKDRYAAILELITVSEYLSLKLEQRNEQNLLFSKFILTVLCSQFTPSFSSVKIILKNHLEVLEAASRNPAFYLHLPPASWEELGALRSASGGRC